MRPNIYNFQNVVDYLVANFQYEKSLSPDFSVRKWAKLLEINSESLAQILQQKKKVSSLYTDKFSVAFCLKEDEQKYLEAMVKFSQAELEREKQVLEIILSELKMHTGTVAYVEDQSIFSHWVHMAILSMSRVSKCTCNKETLRDFLIFDVSDEIIDESIVRLLKSNLIQIDDQGTITKAYDNVTSINDAYRAPQHPYFQQVSDLAKDAVENFSAQEREFQCFSLPINSEKLPIFKEMIRHFRSKICSLTDQDSTNQVYQMNIQFFPISREINYTEVQEGQDIRANLSV